MLSEAAPATPVPVLEFDDVSFTYGRVPILHQVSLCVHEGEFVAVVGANGSGKTTLMKLGLGLLRPTAGRIRLFGTDVGTFDEWEKVGYVPQRATAMSALPVSVEEVIQSGLAARPRLFARRSREECKHLEDVVDLLGLSADRRSRMSQLSGGQQQRTLIARALITAPRLLIMDEPTAGVDADARGVLRDSLEHLVNAEGMGVVYVSHDPEGFAGLAHRVVEVDGGRAQTAGRDRNLLAEVAWAP